jgi:glycosyltransferase involved in cell wall biosynthesis
MITYKKSEDYMLIYFVTGSDAYGIGGLGNYIRELANFLADKKHDVKILCKAGVFPKIYEPAKEVGRAQRGRPESRRHTNRSFLVQAPLGFLPNPLTTFYGFFKLAKSLKHNEKARKIIHIHDLSSSFLIALPMKKLFKLPLAIQIHGFLLGEQYFAKSEVSSQFSNFVWFLIRMWHTISMKIIKSSADIVLVNNKQVKTFYESYGISSNRLVVVPSAMNLRKHEKKLLSLYQSKKCLGIDPLENVFVVGYIGVLYPIKNVNVLIKAFRDFVNDKPAPKATLVIIGDGPMKSMLEETVKKYNLGCHVFFLGFIRDAYRFLNAMDIFVLPSLSEGSPLSLIEAMVAGKAIIASNIPAICEIVEHGKDALLFDPHSANQLKDAILTLYQNPKLRAKLSANAKEKAQLYNTDKVFGRILKMYEELVHCKAQ